MTLNKRKRLREALIVEFNAIKQSGITPNVPDLALRLQCSDSWARKMLCEAGLIPSSVPREKKSRQISDDLIQARIEKVRKWKFLLGSKGFPANLPEDVLEKILGD
jgi:hypothetical protein